MYTFIITYYYFRTVIRIINNVNWLKIIVTGTRPTFTKSKIPYEPKNPNSVFHAVYVKNNENLMNYKHKLMGSVEYDGVSFCT